MTDINATPGCGWIQPAAGKALSALQRHLPLGMAWLAFRIPGKVAALLVNALSRAFDDAWAFLCRLADELDPRTADELLPEWETALGLPDACLPTVTTLEQRRALVMMRLSKRRWTTAVDWQDLAALFGLQIEITPGWLVQKPALFGDGTGGFGTFEFPLSFDNFPKLGRFRAYIDVKDVFFDGFEYGAAGHSGFPIPFLSDASKIDSFICIIERVKPANVVIVWNANPLRNGCYAETFEQTFSDSFCSEAMTP